MPRVIAPVDMGYNLVESHSKANLEVPDYASYDYSGEKHWKWANDPFYADPEEWIRSAPPPYDSLAQLRSMPYPGVTWLYK